MGHHQADGFVGTLLDRVHAEPGPHSAERIASQQRPFAQQKPQRGEPLAGFRNQIDGFVEFGMVDVAGVEVQQCPILPGRKHMIPLVGKKQVVGQPLVGRRIPGQLAARGLDDRFAGQQILSTMCLVQLEPTLGRQHAKHFAAGTGRIVDPLNRRRPGNGNRRIELGDQTSQPELTRHGARQHRVVPHRHLARLQISLVGGQVRRLDKRGGEMDVGQPHRAVGKPERGSHALRIEGGSGRHGGAQKLLLGYPLAVVGPKRDQRTVGQQGVAQQLVFVQRDVQRHFGRPIDFCHALVADRGRPEERQHDPHQENANERNGHNRADAASRDQQVGQPVDNVHGPARFSAARVSREGLLVHKSSDKNR